MLEGILEQRIEDIIVGMSIDEQFYLYSKYAECNYYEAPCECNEFAIDDLLSGMSPSEIISKYGDIDFSWDYFIFDGWGDIVEWEGIEDISEVVDYIISNSNDLDNADIRYLLEDFEEELDDYVYDLICEETNLNKEYLEEVVYKALFDNLEVEKDDLYEEDFEIIEETIEYYIEDNKEEEDEE